MSIADCFKKINKGKKVIGSDEVKLITERVAALTKSGMPSKQAEIKAVTDLLNEVTAERNTLANSIMEAMGIKPQEPGLNVEEGEDFTPAMLKEQAGGLPEPGSPDIGTQAKTPPPNRMIDTLYQSAATYGLPDTIEIDGVQRPTTNSKGLAIADTEEKIRAFYEWFGDSKVVDEDGRPLVVYHGTVADFSEFKTGLNKVQGEDGIFFATDPDVAARYSGYDPEGNFHSPDIGNTMPVYLSAKNPLVVDFNGDKFGRPEAIRRAKEAGYDSVVLRNHYDAGGVQDQWVVFDPSQIKSAIGNRGTFDAGSPNILFQSAFHGSPFRFDKFTLDHIGKGEGAQAFGWGLYFAGNKQVAEYYRKGISYRDTVREFRKELPNDADFDEALTAADTMSPERARVIRALAADEWLGFDYPAQAITAVFKEPGAYDMSPELQEAVNAAQGQLYEVSIPEDDTMLLWDKPLSEQSEKVISALQQAGFVDNRKAVGEFDDALYAALQTDEQTELPKQPSDLSGENIYKRLIGLKGSDESASKYLNDLGITGIKYLDGTSRGKGEGSFNYVIFDDSAIEILKTYYQSQNAVPNRGAFNPETLQITLLKNADLSTFLHESGHFFFENDIALASELVAEVDDITKLTPGEQQIVKDVSGLLKWHGIQGTIHEQLAQWHNMSFEERRSSHERTAESFEKYLFEGKAPSIELQPYFQTFKAWLKHVYTSLKDFLAGHPEAGQLNDEVRGIFDRMLATDDQIALAEQSRSMMPLITDAEQVGWTAERLAQHHALGKEATATAVQELDAKGLRDMQWSQNKYGKVLKKLQKEHAEKRREVRAAVRVEVMSQPVYRAWQFLTKKTDETVTEEAVDSGRLDRVSLADMDLPVDVLGRLDKLKMVKKDALHPDIVADLIGFNSGDEMVRALAAAPTPKEAIEAATDERMLQTYGELSQPGALERAADLAVHNEVRTKMYVTEANALAKATGKPKILAEAAKNFAAEMISRKKIKDIKPLEYTHAETRAAKLADKAMRAGDLVVAAGEARNKVINAYAVKAAYAAQEEVDKGVRHLKRVTSNTALKNMRGESKAQLLAILDRFDIRKSVSLKELERTQKLAEFVSDEADRLAAPVPELSPVVSDETNKTHYKNLTLEEFRGLMDSIKQLEHLARREQKAYIAIRNLNIQQEVSQGVAEIREAWPQAFDEEGKAKVDVPLTHQYAKKLGTKLEGAMQELNAEFVPIEELVDQFTAGKFGLLHDSLFGRLSHASDKKAQMAGEIKKRLKPAYDAYSFKEKRDFSRVVVFRDGPEMTRENLLMLMLNYGNVEGRQRLMSQGFTDFEIARRIKHLTDKDINLAEAIWSLNDDYIWPMYAALNERTQGKAPPKVEASPMTVNGRNIKGGYIKLVYDSAFNEKTRKRETMDDAMAMIRGAMNMTAKTEQGSSKERIAELKRMPLLELRAVTQAVNEHMHDIAYREAVADTVRVLQEPDMMNAIKAVAGIPVYTELLSKVNEIASRPREPSGFILKTLSLARKNTIVVLLSGVKTALVNYSGLIPAMWRVNAGGLVKNVGKVHSHRMMEMIRFVINKSLYMAERNQQYTSDLQHEMASLTVKNKLMPEMGTFLILMRMIDQITSTIVWLTAYEDGQKKFKGDDARAVEYADTITRSTQGSGRDVDTSKIMTRFGEWSKLFTMFYSYFNRQLSGLVRQGVISKQSWVNGRKAQAVGSFAAAYMLISVIPALINDLASGRCDDAIEGSEGWARCVSRALAANASGFVPVLRDFVPYVWGKMDDKEPNYGLRMTPATAYFEGIGSGLASGVDVIQGDNNDKDTKAIFMGLAFASGLPGKLMWDTIMGTEAVINEDAPLQSALFGPPKK